MEILYFLNALPPWVRNILYCILLFVIMILAICIIIILLKFVKFLSHLIKLSIDKKENKHNEETVSSKKRTSYIENIDIKDLKKVDRQMLFRIPNTPKGKSMQKDGDTEINERGIKRILSWLHTLL